jgi:hypothetical protein
MHVKENPGDKRRSRLDLQDGSGTLHVDRMIAWLTEAEKEGKPTAAIEAEAKRA